MEPRRANRDAFEPRATRAAGARGWARLLAGTGLLLVFVFVLAPLGQRWTPWGELGRIIAERDIEANAYFYTEVEAFATAESTVRDALTHRPAATEGTAEAAPAPLTEPD
jgi:hypothetical protein